VDATLAMFLSQWCSGNIFSKNLALSPKKLLLAALRKLVVADLALLKAMVHSRESNSAFLDLNSSSERMPF
jgi:hypothetical protein